MYKLCFYVPESHLNAVKNALFAIGAGRFQAYDQCCWQVRGEGQFRPLTSTNPYLGEIGQLHQLEEFKVEMICDDSIIRKAVTTLIATHPYEEPAYKLYQIMTFIDLHIPQ